MCEKHLFGGAGAKALRGADKESCNDLALMVNHAAGVVVKACVEFEIIPFFRELDKCLSPSAHEGLVSLPAEMLRKESCILHMQAAVDNKIMAPLNNFCKFYGGFVTQLGDAMAEKLEAAAAQKALLEWDQHMSSFLSSVQTACLDHDALSGFAKGLSERVASTLQGQVNKETHTHALKCIDFLKRAHGEISSKAKEKDPVPFSSEEVGQFETHLRKARELSSVLGDAGTTIRNGLLVVEGLVGFFVTFVTDGKASAAKEAKLSKQDCNILSLYLGFLKEEDGSPGSTPRKVINMMDLIQGRDQDDAASKDADFAKLVTEIWTITSEESKTVMKDIVDDLDEELKAEVKKHQEWSLAIPPELSAVTSLQGVLDFKEKILEIFNLEQSNRIADSAVVLEKWLSKAKGVAKKLKVEISFVVDEASGQSAWRNCLLWMPLGLFLSSC